ncbi:efflux RND transporter periplasmic adaptor subunit [Solitalea longa]|uniref:Efflux RND transporter periplasmic adaptor subunit n=1 Tax=Solitalea longa TaxID=2079460 RepID=A0A2S5A2C2_9SPHI|nr:efflux RND transporter periplasmic adaptor subunit [Solitalea longa]POY36422.1 efflux RND transporter periplasmic adaptor subunit [Solitalea longa]
MKKVFIVIYIFSAALFITACGNSSASKSEHAEHVEEGHEHEDEHASASTVSLTNEQMKSIGVQLGKIEQKNLTSTLKANGVLKVPNQNKATATALFGGVVKSILVQPGSFVKKGQTIATIVNTQFVQMQEEYLSVSAKITLAELEYNRQKELTSGNAGALKNFQQADAELKTLRTRKASLQQQLSLLGISASSLNNSNLSSAIAIKSPIAGSISNIQVNIGSYVSESTSIADIVDNSQLHLDLSIFEQDIQKVNNKQIINFVLTNNPSKSYSAAIFSIGSSFENGSKTIPVHALVKGDKTGLIDGMNISAMISLDNVKVPAIPTEAIVNYQGQDYVFIQTADEEHHEEEKNAKHSEPHEDVHQHEAGEANDHKESGEKAHVDEPGNTFERIPVKKGVTYGGYTEITMLKETPADANIVIKGAFFVLGKMTNAGEGHSH